MRRRVCFVVSSEMTVRAFLRRPLASICRVYDLTLIVNTENSKLLSELGIDGRVVPIQVERKISLGHDAMTLARTTAFMRREGFDLVHSITPKAGLTAMVASRLAHVPVRVHTFTGQVWATRRGAGREVLKAADRVIARAATDVWVDSPSQRDFIVSEGILPREKAVVLGAGSVSGVDLERFRPDPEARRRVRASLGITEDQVMLLFIGRINRDKGVLDLARAFAEIAPRSTQAHLVFTGPDEESLTPELRAILGDHGARAHFTGATKEPAAFMAAADLMCLPSYREGFGSVIIEAAACGTPALASRIYGLTDAVVDGVTGLLHAPHDVSEIGRSLERLLRDPERRATLGRAALDRARVEFSDHHLTDLWLDGYERAFARVPS